MSTVQAGVALRRWIRRYLPAESVSVLAAVGGAMLAWQLTASWEAAALAGNWAETGAFYLVMATREFVSIHVGRGRLATLPLVFRNLTMEFALAEALDSFVTRPVFMDVAMHVTGDVAIGTIIGKLIADVTFYVPTIISYELRRRYLDAPNPLTSRGTAVAPAAD